MFWVLLAAGASVPFLVYGLFRWASADPGIDAEIAKDRFRAEQDWRGLRRAGKAEQQREAEAVESSG